MALKTASSIGYVSVNQLYTDQWVEGRNAFLGFFFKFGDQFFISLFSS